MANLNKVMLIGNMTRDPELKYLPSQTPVCEFGLAVSRTWTGQDGVKKEETTFVDCTCFSKQAEVLAKYKKKGDPLFIEGRLKLDQWEAQDGSKRSKMRVIIENFQFLNRSSGQFAGQNTGQGGGQQGGYSGEAEYAGESSPVQTTPAARQPYRPAGRPAAQPAPRPAPAPAAPNYEAGDVPSIPEDDQPQIKEDDIPF